VDLEGEAADRRREHWRAWGGFGNGAAAGLSGGQLFTWRRLAREGRLGDEGSALVAVELMAPAAASPAKPERADDTTTASARASKGAGLMVIELGNGHRIRVDRDFDADALGRVLDILDRRR
jgi:transposase